MQVEDALNARKNVLSQKPPFVLDLDVGERLAALADQKHVCVWPSIRMDAGRPIGAICAKLFGQVSVSDR